MLKPKVKIFGEPEKPGTIYRYSGFESLCEEYSETPWCSGKTRDFLTNMMVRFPKPLYVLQDVNGEGQLKEWLIYQNPSGANIINSDGKDITKEELVDEIGLFKKIDEVLIPMIQPGADFKDIVKRFLYGRATVEEVETLPTVVELNLRRSGNSYGSSRIHFKLDKDTLLTNLNLNEYDEWEMRKCLSAYSYYGGSEREYIDHYSVQEHFSDGHFYLSFFSDENKERLRKLVQIILPNERIPDNLLQVNDYVMAKFWAHLKNSKLSDYFEPLIDIIVYEINEQIGESICEAVNKEWKEFLYETNASYYDFDKEELVYDLSNLYVTLTMNPAKFINPKYFVDTFGQEYSGLFGDWGENPFEYENYSEVQTDSINRELDQALDSLEEKIGDVDWDEYEKTQRGMNKLGFKVGYSKSFKPDTKYDIIWTGIDPKDSKVLFKISKGLQQSSFSLPFDKFVNLFTNQKLFSFETLFGF